MQLTNNEKLKMVIEHVNEGKSLSHICERYNYKNASKLKYWINLYKKTWRKHLYKLRKWNIQKRYKIIGNSKSKNGESIKRVSVDLGLIEPAILGDWIKLFETEGKQRIQDTYSRKSYLNEDERYKKTIDKKIEEENKRLKAEIEYLKKIAVLSTKARRCNNKTES